MCRRRASVTTAMVANAANPDCVKPSRTWLLRRLSSTEHLLRRTDSSQSSFVENGDPLREPYCLRGIVGHNDASESMGDHDLMQQGLDLPFDTVVEGGSGFV